MIDPLTLEKVHNLFKDELATDFRPRVLIALPFLGIVRCNANCQFALLFRQFAWKMTLHLEGLVPYRAGSERSEGMDD